MSHKEQQEYCLKIKNKFPEYFENKDVLDVGSLDINGSNRDLFTNSSYLGIDVGPGKNVDFVSKTHEFNSVIQYDTIISTECFEHDCFYDQSLRKIVEILKQDGLFVFTCATTNRPEHGTKRTSPQDAPLLTGDWADYYKNLTEFDIRQAIDIDFVFKEYAFEVNNVSHDLYFYGIRA